MWQRKRQGEKMANVEQVTTVFVQQRGQPS